MKKSIFIILFFAGINCISYGQLNKLFSTTYYNPKIDNFAFSFGIGNSVFHGDVAEFDENIAPSFRRINVNVGVNYRLRSRFRARAELTYYRFYNRTSLETHRDDDPIFEVSALESNISFMFDLVSKDAIDKGYKKFNAYSHIGLGTTTISKKTPPKKKIVRASGDIDFKEGLPVAPVLIFGGGLEYYYTTNISVAFEWGFRATVVDNIDYITNTDFKGFSDSYFFYGYKLFYAPTHGFSIKRYNKKHQNPAFKKKFLGLF